MHWARPTVITDEPDAHEWLHRKLNLIEDQHQQLESVETKFATQHQALKDSLRQANMALAQAMTEEKAYTPRVAAAVDEVHRRMGHLQQISVEHIFAMQAVLSPEQGEELLGLAKRVLEQEP